MSTATAAVDERTRWLLPAHAYTSVAWYEREQRDLFERTWNLVAYVCDLTGGREVVASIGRERVVVSADDGGTIRAVRHTERPPAGAEPCAVGVWAGLVFAHLDPGAADSFTAWLGAYPSPPWVGVFPWGELVEIGRLQFDLACNWKLYIENHVDVYHLWFLHDESLGMFDHAGLTWLADDAGHWSCAETLRPGQERARPTLQRIDGITDTEAQTLRANLLWPNVPMTTSSTTVNTYQVIPTGPTTCRLDLRIRARRGGALDGALAAQMQRILVDEDGFACEQLQRNLASPWFAVGPLAQRHERPIMLFHRHVLEHLA